MKDFREKGTREYGLPKPKVKGVPFAKPANIAEGCPGCGCKQLMTIEIDVEQELVRGNDGVGTYIGCPACTFASPMIIVSKARIKEDEAK